MSEGMLGMLKLSEVQGLRADLEEKLASDSGSEWRDELKKFLRKQTSWVGDRVIYPSKCTNLMEALTLGEKFAKSVFPSQFEDPDVMPGDYAGPLWQQFSLPETLPWKKVLAIFQPEGTNYQDCIEAVKKNGKFKIKVQGPMYDIVSHHTSEKSKRLRLFLTEFSETPNENNMGERPRKLIESGQKFLGLGQYALAAAQHYELTPEHCHFDVDGGTITFFPHNQLSFAKHGVIAGYWDGKDHLLRFESVSLDTKNPEYGAREMIEVPPRHW